jgi:hypothetical protein
MNEGWDYDVPPEWVFATLYVDRAVLLHEGAVIPVLLNASNAVDACLPELPARHNHIRQHHLPPKRSCPAIHSDCLCAQYLCISDRLMLSVPV